MNETDVSREAPERPLNYEQYVDLLDTYSSPSTSFHPSGIREAEQLAGIATRPNVFFVEDTPASLPVDEAADLVAVDRCLTMAQEIVPDIRNNDVEFALLPLGFVVDNHDAFRTRRQEQGAGKKIVFVESDESLEADEERIGSTPGMRLHRLVHPLTNTGAQLVAYEAFNAMHIDIADEAHQRTLAEVLSEKLIPDVHELEKGRVIKVAQGNTFTEAQEADLWTLFSQRFDDISTNSPTKLEEDRETTVEHLFRNPDYTFIYQVSADGKVDACALLADNRDAYPWMSQQYLEKRDAEAEAKYHERPYEVFVPGVAAYKESGMSASAGLLRVMSELIAATNHPYTAVRFECTDVSSLYIPMLVERAIKLNPAYAPVGIQELGRKSYYALEIDTVTEA